MNTNQKTLFVITLLTLASIARLLPHPVNFTPLLAIALFSGRHIPGRFSGIGLVFLSMIVIDLPYIASQVIPQSGETILSKLILVNAAVYGTVLGLTYLAQKTRHCKSFRVGLLGSLAASMAFFVITNFASWLAFYPNSWSGFASCYASAIPYFKNTWISTLLYSGILLGCLSLFNRFSATRLNRPATDTQPGT